MIDILFKGKTTDTKRWIYGSLVVAIVHQCKHYYVTSGRTNINDGNIDFEKFEVIPETVSQFTGKYIDNTRIFDGDILEWCDDYDDSWGFPNTALTRTVVSWDENDCCWVLKHDGKDECICTFTEYDKSEWENMNLIGNIYDNPELLLDYNKQVTTV